MTEKHIELIPFLMHRVITKVADRATEEFEALGLTIQMSRLLITVRANPGIRVGQLAVIVGLEISALSHLLRRMTRGHLVRRTRSEDDQRAIAVTLTPEGDSMAQQCLAISRRHEALMLEEVAPETREFLRHLLRRMLANVEKALPGAASQSLDTGARAAEPKRPPVPQAAE